VVGNQIRESAADALGDRVGVSRVEIVKQHAHRVVVDVADCVVDSDDASQLLLDAGQQMTPLLAAEAFGLGEVVQIAQEQRGRSFVAVCSFGCEPDFVTEEIGMWPVHRRIGPGRRLLITHDSLDVADGEQRAVVGLENRREGDALESRLDCKSRWRFAAMWPTRSLAAATRATGRRV